ncbi:hypothetical protein CVH10_14080 [Halomonas sp. ND22Bw]|uniref:Uncharacterized protein n=1 Tax=Halomonas salina TaxID=42565 RepID=A0ABR4WTW9_9GAMM|nr:hypothetical protein [Halomonas salina]KGE78165.1 hypothetical protein FP66_04800 [Halomonas salina]PSJ21069.1 hypothetical protein CVH10_14080 [Halomonas sp. ND22Bw]
MTHKRPFIFLLAIPVVLILALAGFIFGGQALSDSGLDRRIQQALADELGASGEIELKNLQEVQYGYGICGLYRTEDAEHGYASFFYDTNADRLTLDITSRRYQSHCSLSAVC